MGGTNLFGISFPATVGPRIFSYAVGKNTAPPLGAKSRDVLATVAFLCAMSNKNTSTYLAKQRKTGFDILY